MSVIYITGHRNPDMDSICSALGYANLKNLIDPKNEYRAVRCSHLGEGTKKLLAALEITAPPYMADVYPKVSDVMLPADLRVDADDPLTEYAAVYKASNPSAIPVFEGDEYYGLISVDDITTWAVSELSGEAGVMNVPKVRDVAHRGTDRLEANDRFEDGKSALLSYKKRGLPVFDGDEFAGYVTRRCFLDTPHYNVILVDHNEQSQSIKGLETANIVEIIDHHRLNALKTEMPLFIDAEPLGSTCTIVYQLYLRNGIRPDPKTAKILLTGIITDTLILKSPTTTPIDVESAYALSAISGENVEEYGRNMFSNIEGLKSRDPQAAITSDFKVYKEQGTKIGIGQCEVTSLQDLDDYSETYLNALEEVRVKNGLDWAAIMVTDVIKEHSVLLSTPFRAERHLQYAKLSEHIFDMPGVMSRKKQLLPEMFHSLGVS